MALGSIVVDLLLRTGAFNNDAKLAERRLKDLGKEARAAGTILGTALAAGLTAVAVQTRNLIRESQQITTLSRLSGEAAGKFQEWSLAARATGVEQEKLADILKDTQDKVGDFLQTGGGGMKDFFEQIAPKVGVTAEQFRRLNGSDALQLYVSSLEKANVSQAEMTFYMEAIASDSSKLVPLLKNNGDGFKYWADYAREAGAVMDDQTLEATRRLDVELTKMGISIDGLWKQSLPGLLPTLEEFAGLLNSNAFRDGFGYIINGAVTAAQKLTEFAVQTANVMNWLGEEVARRLHGASGDDLQGLIEQRDRILKQLRASQKFGGTATGVIDATRSAVGLMTTDELRKELARVYRDIDNFQPPKASAPPTYNPAAAGILDMGTGNMRTDPKAAEKAARDAASALDALMKAEQEAAKVAQEFTAAQDDARRMLEDMRAEAEGPAAVALLNYSRMEQELGLLMAENVLTFQEYAEAMQLVHDAREKEIASIGNQAMKVADEMTVFAEQAQRNMQSWLGDSLYNGLSGKFDGIADAFSDMLKRMAAEMMASQVLKFFMGDATTGQGGLFDLFSGGLGYQDGGMCGVSRTVPRGTIAVRIAA